MNDAASSSSERQKLTDALVRVRSGDRSAFAEVYRRTSAKLFGICLRILESRSEAEEALQEAYVNVWQKAAAYDPSRSSPITWLAALARNRAIDRLRARGSRRSEAMGDEAFEVPDPSALAPEVIEASQDRARLNNCIGELDTTHAEAVRAAFFRGLTYGDLAERQGVPLGTMKSWIRRSLIRLKECLQR